MTDISSIAMHHCALCTYTCKTRLPNGPFELAMFTSIASTGLVNPGREALIGDGCTLPENPELRLASFA